MVPGAPKKSEPVSAYVYKSHVGGDALIDDLSASGVPAADQTILVGELYHRLQNTLAIVLALSRLTARTVNSLDEFQIAFGHRIEAMARTNDLLLRGQVQAVSVKAALETELRPYLDDRGQVTLVCDPLTVSSDTAQNLSLIFHELATNAVKYGGLSTLSGRLSVQCLRSDLGGTLIWQEHLTSPPPPRTRDGSGSLLIERLARTLGGSSRIDLLPYGLRAEITFSLGAT